MANTLKNVEIRLVNTDGAHFKFWTISVASRTVRLSWGRIGAKRSQTRKFSFRNNEEAVEFMHKRVDIRLRGGFRQIATFDVAA